MKPPGSTSSARVGRDTPCQLLKLWLVLVILQLPFTLLVRAQTHSIDWHTIDGGGGTSTGSVYSVSGTIGQPDAGTMSDSGYSLNGGFWSLHSIVQTPGAPLLTITLSPTNTAIIPWPAPSTGFTLQQNTNSVTSVNWSNVTTGIQDSGSTKSLFVNPPAGDRFYRLFKP